MRDEDVNYKIDYLNEDYEYLANLSVMSKFAGKTVLFTGATGMFASYMIKVILKFNEKQKKRGGGGRKCNIIAICRDEEKILKIYGYLRKCPELKFIIHDVCDILSINEHIDYIVHAASLTNPKLYYEKPVDTYSANTIGTHNLLYLALKVQCESFLFISSAAVYGKVEGRRLLNEKIYGDLNFHDYRNSYAESKRMGENMCLSYLKQYGLNTKVARPFHTYGPGMIFEEGKFICDFIDRLFTGKDIVLKSEGNQIRNFCYLRDTIWQLFCVLLLGEKGEIYNIGNETESYTIREFVTYLLKAGERQEIGIRSEITCNLTNPSNLQDMNPDLQKINALLKNNQNAMFSLAEGLKRLILSIK